MLVYAATIFLSAFLLFQVQPLIAKFILPWFGGSAAVWSAALLFFQLLLLAGYTYAHFLIRYCSPKKQLIVHSTLLFLALLTLPIIPSSYWKPEGGADPTLRIMILLGATIGLPYLLLSSTSPLLQAWYVRKHKGAIPYKLFALSNFGSMLALLSYPALVEPRMVLSLQAKVWSVGFAAFAIVCAIAAFVSSKEPEQEPLKDEVASVAEAAAERPTAGRITLWIALSACASALLLATTSHLTQNISPIPLLWVVPLSLYLLSFILCFESDTIYQRWLFLPFGGTSIALFSYGMSSFENNEDVIKKLIPALCGALFVCCMVCHGELAKRKPHPKYLTQYFLMISVGGAIGGVFVALIAPNVFNSYLELPIAVIGFGVLMAIVLWDLEMPSSTSWNLPQLKLVALRVALYAGVGLLVWYAGSRALRDEVIRLGVVAVLIVWDLTTDNLGIWRTRVLLLIGVTAMAGYLGYQDYKENQSYFKTARNFYGVLRVRDDEPEGTVPAQRVLIHGTINHGTEVKIGDNPGRVPTSYFGRTSGINRAIRTKGEKGPIRIGILGLGAGVTASLARKGDTLHYYEINPLVFEIAKTQFDFWNACPADKHLYLGDGRLVLEGMKESEQLDFLAMDAFTSDAVPVHLLTKEAFQVYLRHLKPDGLLAVNVSNRYLDLEPIVAQAGKSIGFSGVVIADDSYEESYYVSSTWIILGKDPNFFNNPNFQDSYVRAANTKPAFREWTDDYSNIMLLNDTLRKFVEFFD